MSVTRETVELARSYNKSDDDLMLKDINAFFAEQKKAKRRIHSIYLDHDVRYDSKNKRINYIRLRMSATKP